MTAAASGLPSLEVCLFGVTEKCPKISTGTNSTPTKTAGSNRDSSNTDTTSTTSTNNNSRTGGPPSLSSFLESHSKDDNTNNTPNKNKKSPKGDALTDYDSLLDNGRWQQAATTHDIDLPILRKIASQGIPDEGSYRGIVWRVLLGYLPLKDVHRQWKETIPPQRHLYRTLVDQYLYRTVDQDDEQDLQSAQRHSTLDSGRELRGQLSKTLHQDRKLRKNYNRVERLDDSMSHVGDWSEHEHTDDNDDEDDDGASLVSEWTMQKQQSQHRIISDATTPSSGTPQNSARSAAFLRSSATVRQTSSQMNVSQRIQHQLPAKYQLEWKQTGIVLDKSESPAALGLNQLRIPQELLEMREKELQSSKPNRSTSHLHGNGNGIHATDATADDSENALAEEEEEDDKTNHVISDANKPALTSSDQDNDHDDDATEIINEHADQLFQQFLQDAKTLEEIRKDVVRTHPDLRFYLESQDNLGIRRYAALERILFVWAKLNKGVRYVQGMNEIAATIYYVLANDLNAEFAVYAEADTYYLFHTLMSGSDMMRDVFVADLDDSKSGIQGRIANVQMLLQRHDPELFHHLEDIGMDPSFYAIRWLTTLLSREFLLPDTIRLWDSMFASTHKENFLRYVCGSMVMKVRDDLIKGDFSRCLRLLQSYPPTNVEEILESSRSLWIYESQVTMACHRGGISLNQALHAIHPPPGIIMAFGFKGGVAPTLSDQIHDAAAVVQEQVEQTTSGLFSRAKRFLREKAGAAASYEADSNREEVTAPPSLIEPKEDTVNDPKGTSQSDPTTTPNDETTATDQSNAPPPTRLRHRMWNAWNNRTAATTSSTENRQDPIPDHTQKESLEVPSTQPKKPRAWNRGRTESYGRNSNSEELKRTPVM
ncbi:Rab-GTPase-TBC domain containing protein [Nitzschia inconspicua]|uniref:Rab-GTPase-TBC domain containing protein n=1 Tax=Nitzschia inconspicua TaxID=303405 RepID=A0A9K3KMI8_9STRA|nr:Rab-GTPase-TBC domain containing protein [Nitzschia inconspicua]